MTMIKVEIRRGAYYDSVILMQLQRSLAQQPGIVDAGGGGDQDYRPRGIETAAKMLPHANWVLVSVPGRYAAGVARQAMSLNKHVFLYSDNVSLEDEISLKQEAAQKGLLVMGPDCGTAIVNGIGLGVADKVRKGPIGLVAASGTGPPQDTARL